LSDLFDSMDVEGGRMSSDNPGDLDLADIEVTQPPADWTPEVTDDDPDPADAADRDEEADA
jgi:hypothetical protein